MTPRCWKERRDPERWRTRRKRKARLGGSSPGVEGSWAEPNPAAEKAGGPGAAAVHKHTDTPTHTQIKKIKKK